MCERRLFLPCDNRVISWNKEFSISCQPEQMSVHFLFLHNFYDKGLFEDSRLILIWSVDYYICKLYTYNHISSFSTMFHSKLQAKINSHESTFTLWTDLRMLQLDWSKIKTRSTAVVSDLSVFIRYDVKKRNSSPRITLLIQSWCSRVSFNELNLLWLRIRLVTTVNMLSGALITKPNMVLLKGPLNVTPI